MAGAFLLLTRDFLDDRLASASALLHLGGYRNTYPIQGTSEMQTSGRSFSSIKSWEWVLFGAIAIALGAGFCAEAKVVAKQDAARVAVRPAVQEAVAKVNAANAQVLAGNPVAPEILDALAADAAVAEKNGYVDVSMGLKKAIVDLKAGREAK